MAPGFCAAQSSLSYPSSQKRTLPHACPTPAPSIGQSSGHRRNRAARETGFPPNPLGATGKQEGIPQTRPHPSPVCSPAAAPLRSAVLGCGGGGGSDDDSGDDEAEQKEERRGRGGEAAASFRPTPTPRDVTGSALTQPGWGEQPQHGPFLPPCCIHPSSCWGWGCWDSQGWMWTPLGSRLGSIQPRWLFPVVPSHLESSCGRTEGA